jgi:alanyl-tRNA synthetase
LQQIFKHMKSLKEIRKQYLDFFASKGHRIVPSAPVVNQNDPTLMFINSGMAQFKDYFLGNQKAPSPRIADTQKCLRVSGKHNDLEDVGMDGTHHTLFEMLGNWSFGDYFKKEAIQWSWELLTDVYKIPADRLYATVFEGDPKENLGADEEAYQLWLQYLPADRIVYGNKKDNFWEMGDTGPCGPCTEIHVDLRADADRVLLAGQELVNKDHPLVIEIWNNVFMQFERSWNDSLGGASTMLEWERNYEGTKDGSTYKKARNEKHTELTLLKELSAKHVDTGMGLERLCMVIQGVHYTYDTDAFKPIIQFLEENTGFAYKGSFQSDAFSDIAMRVIADHMRAVTLVIADGQLPSNTGAGYVVRRILRRAVRYYYSFLGVKDPIMYRILPILSDMFTDVFPEVAAQEAFISQVIKSEEESFLKTLSNGLKRLEEVASPGSVLEGRIAFELYDTFGFPIDLTMLLGREKGFEVDEKGFEKALAEQKDRSKRDAEKETGNWTEISVEEGKGFVGYDQLCVETRILKYRKVSDKKNNQYHVVLRDCPFYPEGGGQVGDRGHLIFGDTRVEVLDTKKENDLVICIVSTLPTDISANCTAVVNRDLREKTERNHSATHLLHAALRSVLGHHVQQKGSLVTEELLRFDFAHFQKMTPEEMATVEARVNQKIREAISLDEKRSIPIEEARNLGATMLFGEKYGERVRLITFDSDYSKELCGGCHVQNTGKIGFFKIIEESSIAAGVRRIVAITGETVENYIKSELGIISEVRSKLNQPKDVVKAVEQMQEDLKKQKKMLDILYLKQAQTEKKEWISNAINLGEHLFVSGILSVTDKEIIKQVAAEITQNHHNAIVVIGVEEEGQKVGLYIQINKDWADQHKLNAGQYIKAIAPIIEGGGGGQNFSASAGGKNPAGLKAAIDKIKEILS